MALRFKKIQGKMVQLSEPYNASFIDMVGREAEMRKILAAWKTGENRFPMAPLLIGNPGVGKTRFVCEMSKRLGKEFYTYQCHEEVTNEDLVCTIRQSDTESGKFHYILRALPTAMILGEIFFIDGIAKMRKKALAIFESLLDERRYIESDLLGFRIPASPGFRFIASTNNSDLDTNPLSDYMKSRCKPVINFTYPSRETINRILLTRYSRLPENGKSLLDLFWHLWRGRNNGIPPSPRDAIDVFSYALGLAEIDIAEHSYACTILDKQGAPCIFKENHLEEAFDALFNKEVKANS
jgi:MoxR-like ATPase